MKSEGQRMVYRSWRYVCKFPRGSHVRKMKIKRVNRNHSIIHRIYADSPAAVVFIRDDMVECFSESGSPISFRIVQFVKNTKHESVRG